MIKAASQLDWFNVDRNTYTPFHEVIPGARIKREGFQLHRTHLPLVEQLEAARICSTPPINFAMRKARDQLTMERGGFKLRVHQHVAVEYSQRRRGVLIADEPRVGKTLSAIMSHDPSLGSLVIIAPLMVRETWLGWLRRAFPDEDIGIMLGRKFDRQLAMKPVVFGHSAIVHAWGSDVPIGTLIVDEIHDYSNPKSKRSIGIAMLASRAQRVIGLTGTPIWNRPIGLWAILSLISPGAFGSHEEFGWRYCDAQPTEYGTLFKGSTRPDELEARLEQIKIRRLHRDICTDLPPIMRDVIIADVSDVQRRKLDIAAEGLRKSDRTNTAGMLARYRAVLGEVKIDVSLAYIRRVLEAGEPLVVWTWHKSLARKLHAVLEEESLPAILIHGDIPPGKREERFITWKAHPASALVITIPTGNVGIDLSHAFRSLTVEIDYNPPLMEQADMRIYSPLRPSYNTYVVADHLSDRRVVEALSSKLTASRPLGLTSAEGAIDLLYELTGRPKEEADMDRLMQAMIDYDEEHAA